MYASAFCFMCLEQREQRYIKNYTLSFWQHAGHCRKSVNSIVVDVLIYVSSQITFVEVLKNDIKVMWYKDGAV